MPGQDTRRHHLKEKRQIIGHPLNIETNPHWARAKEKNHIKETTKRLDSTVQNQIDHPSQVLMADKKPQDQGNEIGLPHWQPERLNTKMTCMHKSRLDEMRVHT
jgi:hypothetical protein